MLLLLRCAYCKLFKTPEEFHSAKTTRGRQGYCKLCMRIMRHLDMQRIKEKNIAIPPIPPAQQYCLSCKTSKPSEEFWKDITRPNGLHKYCKSCTKEKYKEYKKSHPEIIQKIMKKFDEAHPHHGSKSARKWERDHPEEAKKMRARKNRARRARMSNASNIEKIDLEEIYIRDKGICNLCHKKVLTQTKISAEQATLDHIIPLSCGGSHTCANVVLAHRRCNSSKGNRVVPQQLRLY